MANIPATNIASTIRPFTLNDVFPTALQDEIYGGFHTVPTMTGIDTLLPIERRQEGMWLNVLDESTIYEWEDVTGTLTWVAKEFAPAAGITGSGTQNTLPKFATTATLGDSIIREENGVIIIDGDVLATGGVQAYSDLGGVGSIFDNIPRAGTYDPLLIDEPTDPFGLATFNQDQFTITTAGYVSIQDGIFLPAAHTHVIDDVTGLQIALDDKLIAADLTPYALLAGANIFTENQSIEKDSPTLILLNTTASDVLGERTSEILFKGTKGNSSESNLVSLYVENQSVSGSSGKFSIKLYNDIADPNPYDILTVNGEIGSVNIGFGNTSGGLFSSVLGSNSDAAGDYSLALGYGNNTNGDNAITLGSHLSSDIYKMISIGSYNEITTLNPSNWVNSDPLFVIGNGIDTNNRSNALTVLKDGRIGIKTSTPQLGYILDIEGNLLVTGNIIATGGIQAYSDTGDLGSIFDNIPLATAYNVIGQTGIKGLAGFDDLDFTVVDGVVSLIPITSGTFNHSEMNELDYASSGHTGFAAELSGTIGALPYYDTATSLADSPLTTDGTDVTTEGNLFIKDNQIIYHPSIYSYSAKPSGFPTMCPTGNGYLVIELPLLENTGFMHCISISISGNATYNIGTNGVWTIYPLMENGDGIISDGFATYLPAGNNIEQVGLHNNDVTFVLKGGKNYIYIGGETTNWSEFYLASLIDIDVVSILPSSADNPNDLLLDWNVSVEPTITGETSQFTVDARLYGTKISELYDVEYGVVTDKNRLEYNSTTSKWGYQPALVEADFISGTQYAIPYYDTANSLGDSPIYTDGTNIGIGITVPTAGYILDVNGNLLVTGNIIATGGIQAYSDTGEVGSIFDNIPLATTTSVGLASFDATYFAVDVNGHVTSIMTGGVIDHTELTNIGTNTHAQIDTFIASKGAVSGLAELDASGLVPSSQLPGYVDDVIMAANLAAIELIDPLESGKIYVAEDTNITYRWSGVGTTMVIISSTLALGETISTAYRGDRGKIAYDHSQEPHALILSGTLNTIPFFNTTTTLGDSPLSVNANGTGIQSNGGIASGDSSISLGIETSAVGVNSITIGAYSSSDGDWEAAGIALGTLITASGKGSFGAGYQITVSNEYSTGIGAFNQSTGPASISIGKQNFSTGNTSISIGGGNVSSGTGSFASGIYNTAEAYGTFALGTYNELLGGNPTSIISTDPLLILGNGTDINNRSNALTVLKNGYSTFTNGIAIPFIDFDLNPTLTHQEGRLHWNPDCNTLSLGMAGGAVHQEIGLEFFMPRSQVIGSDVLNGQIVYVSGATGVLPRVSLAIASAASGNTKLAIGMATETILENQLGYITTNGVVRDIDTSAFDEGVQLYLSPTVLGGVTDVTPTAPDFVIKVGIVLRSHISDGSVLVKIENRSSNIKNIQEGTPTEVMYIGTGGNLVGESAFTYDAETLYINNLAVGSATVEAGYTIDSTGNMIIRGNIIATGGIQAYSDVGDVGSIFDNIPLATTTSVGIASFSGTYFAVDLEGEVTLLESGFNEALDYSPTGAWTFTQTPLVGAVAVSLTNHNHTGVYAPVLTADQNYVSDAQLVVIGNTSNTNTGDNAINTLYSGLSGDLTTHANLTTAAHGLGASAFHADNFFALASHGNHVPTTQAANNAVYLRNDNTWQTISAADISAQPVDADLTAIGNLGFAATSFLKKTDANTWTLDTNVYTTNTGTVTSVGLSVPTGFALANTPITSSGTIALSYASGYALPTTAKQTAWDGAVTYAGVGHLPLAGGTLSGNLTMTKSAARIILNESTYASTNSGLQWTTIGVNQDVTLLHEVSDAELPGTAGQALILDGGTTVASFIVDGQFYADSDKIVYNSGNIPTWNQNTTGSSASCTGNAATASSAAKWTTTRQIVLSGDVSGTSPGWDGSGNLAFINTVVANDSHTHATQYLGLTAKAADSEKLDNIDSTGFARYSSTGVLSNALAAGSWVASYAAGNVDHIWHDDTTNAWNFCSDTTFKGTANSRLNVGSLHIASASNQTSETTCLTIAAGVVGYRELGSMAFASTASYLLDTTDTLTGSLTVTANVGAATVTASSTMVATSTMTASNFVLGSDARLKKNVLSLDPTLAYKLRPISHDWIDGRESGYSLGFIAQEVQKISPELVYEGVDGMLGIGYAKITAINNAAIHELNNRVTSNYTILSKNELRIKELENKVTELQSLLKLK